MNRKTSIENIAMILALATIISKILGLMRELVVAYRFGAGSITDAFVLTNGIPSMIFVSIGTAININYIPYYQKLKDKEEQNQFTSNLLNIIIVILLVGCLFVNIFPEFILNIFAVGLPDETKHYAVVMLRIVMFSIIPIIVAHLFQAYSQANGQFITTALFGIVTNVVIIITTFLSTEKNYWFLSVGTIMANAAGMIMIVWGAGKSGFQYCSIFDPFNKQIKTLIFLTLPLMVENIASSMSLIVDRNLASFLESGTISGLSYAGLLGNIAGTMISNSIITATFPSFSRLLASGNKDKFEESFKKYGNVMLFLLCPMAMVMIFYAKDIVIFVFQHGVFSSDASKIVWESMACYAIGIIPSGMQTYLIRVFYALQDTKTPVKIKVFALLCNIALNFAAVFRWRHIGIAMSTSISFIISYILLAYFLTGRYGFASVKSITKRMLVGILLSIIPAALSFILFNYCIQIEELFLKLVLELSVFIICYFGAFGITNQKMVKEAADVLKGRF
jgi:putative peptidoglycan lipid II flippase